VAPVRLALTLEQIQAARAYSVRLLDDVRDDEWFQMPGGVTHVAWQVGHLSFAEYRMCLIRIRGEGTDDAAVLPPEYIKLFGPNTVALPDASAYPAPAELLARLEIVHRAAMQCCAGLSEADLDATCEKPHPLFSSKIGSLLWCARHEMMHAGQIGLLRRLLGKRPLW
jgi:hypothetical protein